MLKKLFKKQNQNGFTLMEMLIVVTIIGILASIVLPRFVSTSAAGEKAAHKAERQTINAQLELFYFQNGYFPVGAGSSAEALKGWTVGWGDYFPDGVPVTNNKNVEWMIKNGRVSLTDMAGGPFE